MTKAEKKLNIYKVVTEIAPPQGEVPGQARVDYVRAKTKAGAAALVAAEYIKVELATTDELLTLAGIAAKGGKE